MRIMTDHNADSIGEAHHIVFIPGEFHIEPTHNMSDNMISTYLWL